MAIKGKRRSRGGKGRARAAAPRPVMVQRKPPLVRRTWFRLTVLAVLVLAAAGITFGVVSARRQAAEEREAREEVQRVGALMEGALVGIGQAIPGGAPVILPELGQAVSGITTGDARPRRVERNAAEWEEGLTTGIERLAEIRTDRGDLRRAVAGVREGLELYLPIVREVPQVARLRGRRGEEAATALLESLSAAGAAVSEGWGIYQQARQEVGLDAGAPQGQPQFPPGGQPQLPPGLDPFAPPGSEGGPVPEPSS